MALIFYCFQNVPKCWSWIRELQPFDISHALNIHVKDDSQNFVMMFIVKTGLRGENGLIICTANWESMESMLLLYHFCLSVTMWYHV